MVVLVVERGTDVVVGGEMAYFLFRIGTRAPIEGTAFSAQSPPEPGGIFFYESPGSIGESYLEEGWRRGRTLCDER